jgi:hypothetical protein
VLALAVVVPTRPAGAEQGYAGACTDGAGVSVVVDAQELSAAAPSTRCAPQAGGHGLEILTKSGVSYETAKRSPGFVCKVAGLPTDEPCQDTSPADAYWSYWLARRGGTWCLSNRGAQARNPPAGTVEGWSFAKGRQDTGPVPPRADPPAVLAGGEPAPLANGDCDSVSKTGATTSTPTAGAPPATATASTARPARPAVTTPVTTPVTTAATPRATGGIVPPSSVDAAATTSEATPTTGPAPGPPVTLDVSPAKSGGGAGAGRALGAAAVVVALGAAGGVVGRRRRRDAAAADESLL